MNGYLYDISIDYDTIDLAILLNITIKQVLTVLSSFSGLLARAVI